MDEMTKQYIAKCKDWMNESGKATLKKTKKYDKVVLPKFSGEPYTEEEFAKIIG